MTFRVLQRQKGYIFINIAGWAAGLAGCMLILLFVIDEISYDRFHDHADRIHRVAVNTDIPNAPPARFAVSNWVPTGVLLSEHPEVENLTRLAPSGSQSIEFTGWLYYYR